MKVIPPKKIYVDKSPIHGLGIFASDYIQEGEIIEVCPVIDLGLTKGVASPVLVDYRFNWPQGTPDWQKQVIACGYGSLYNHSNNPNASWRSNIDTYCFEFYATKNIEPGQEIFVWYGGVEYWSDGREHTNVIG